MSDNPNISPSKSADLATAIPTGVIEEGWFVVKDNVVFLSDRDGDALPGKGNRRPIGPGETAREVAVRLLRLKARSRPISPFNRPLRYRNRLV